MQREHVRTRLEGAITRGLRALEAEQLATGEFPVLTSLSADMSGECAPDPSVFPTALIGHCLSAIPDASSMVGKACDFLIGQRDGHGLWRHWTRDHPYFRQLPPDLDDSSCASALLKMCGRRGWTDPNLLLANRTRDGHFLTWVVPRLARTNMAHMRVTTGQLLHPLILIMFFRKTSAAWNDVDAVVNANCLFFLGRFPGHEPVAQLLLDVLRRGAERDCDKWYNNPFVIWYFLSRALCPLADEARDLILARLSGAEPRTALEHALLALTQAQCGSEVADETIDALLSSQAQNGAWPRAPFYWGGRERRRDGSFAPPHPDTPRWGSEALTTAFCVEALHRSLGAAKA